MLADVVPYLTCPTCDSTLSQEGDTVYCSEGHQYDVARQGYVTLRRRGGFSGDSAPMVMARESFLDAGHFAGLGDLLAEHARAAAGDPGDGPPVDGCVVDVGAGIGYHLARVLDRLPERVGIALDASPYALRRAARAHPRAGAVGADAWQQLPIRSRSAALVVNVLAPRNGPEFQRIAAPGGTLLVVTPTPRHLGELVPSLGLLTVDPHKKERLELTLGERFTLNSRTEHDFPLQLTHQDVTALVGMGPTAWHADAPTLARRVARLAEPVAVTASFVLSSYRAVS